MSKLVALPGGAAVSPDQLVYLRTVAEGAGGAAGPHAVIVRIQGFAQTIPLAMHPNARDADEGMAAIAAQVDEAADGDAELTRLPRALIIKTDEVIFVEVAAERGASGLTYTVRAKTESDERPLELASYTAVADAMEFVAGCHKALGEDFALLDGGIAIKKSKVQRTEVRADGSGPQKFHVALIKVQSEERRLTLGRDADPAAAAAMGAKAVASLNEEVDEDEALRLLPGGFSTRPDGLKGLRVRASKVAGAGGAQQVVYAVVLLTDDDDELPISVLEQASDAETFVAMCVAEFNGGSADESEDDDDDWD